MTVTSQTPPHERVVVCPEVELPAGARTLLVHGHHQVAVFNVDGRLYAVNNRCPHHGGPLCHGSIGGTRLPSDPGQYDWGMEGRVLTCPWHGWQYELDTGQTLFDPTVRVPVHPVAVEDDQIAVYLPA
jgi:3-phenylpropionate/trans-cinnamate dioxygenase ferredoxin subunit